MSLQVNATLKTRARCPQGDRFDEGIMELAKLI